MALTSNEQKELDDLHRKAFLNGFGSLTDKERSRMNELQTKDRVDSPASDQRGVKGQGGAPMSGEEFLRWAHEHGLTAKDFVTTPAAGGGAAPKGGGAAPDSGEATPTLSDSDIRQRIMDQYPAFAWLVDDAQVGPLLTSLAKGEIDQTTFQARLYGTSWWKTHGEAVRQWDTLTHVDPATANARRAAKMAELWNTAYGMGLDDPGYVKTLAETALRFGLSDAQVQDQLSSHIDFNKARFGGAASAVQLVDKLSRDYAVPISRQSQNQWAQKLLAGDIDANGVQAYFTHQAESMYAGNADMADALKRGLSVRDYADPYIQTAARELEINPNTIDLLNPKWHRALQTVDHEGKRVPMSLADWTTTIRTDDSYGWDHTSGARDQAAQFVGQVQQEFGAA